MNSMSIPNDSDENSLDTSHIQNNNLDRRQSRTIKDRVNIFEKQIEELEQKRKSRNLFELTKKFGFQKYLSKDNSQNSQSTQPKNFEIIDFIKEVDDMCQNYEKEIEFHKRKNSAFRKDKNEHKHSEDSKETNFNNSNCDISKSCNNCEITLKQIEELNEKLILKDEELKKLTHENEEMQRRFDDLSLHLNSMMVCLQTPGLNDNDIIPQEEFSSNSNLESIKESYDTNYLNAGINTQSSLPLVNEYVLSNTNFKIETKNFKNSEDKPVGKQDDLRVMLIELVSEIIFNEFISENSLNINSINNYLLDEANLLTYLNTVFIKGANRKMTISIYHEYIETILIHIYLSFFKFKAQKNINMNNFLEFSWVISKEEINDDVVLMTVEDIYSLFYNLKNVNNGQNKIQDKELFFKTTFEKMSYSIDLNVLSLKSEILSCFLNKVRIYEDKIKEDLEKIVYMCRKSIHAGKLVYRNRIIYDFGKLNSEIKNCNKFLNKNSNTLDRLIIPNSVKNIYTMDNKLIYSHFIAVNDSIDNLINNIKYYNDKIDTIVLKGRYIKKDAIEKELYKTKNSAELNVSSMKENIEEGTLSIILINIISNNKLLRRIQSLTINNFKFNEEDFSYLNNIIEFANNLSTLNLNDNFIEDTGLRIISEYMKLNQSLLSINLVNNNITHNGAFYLSDMLLKNNSVQSLYLGRNNISGMGLQSLVNIIINGNKSIKFLDLSDNKLTMNDIIIITNLIIKNISFFEGIDLSNNKLDSDSINTFGLALRTNVFMKSIYLNAIGLNEDSTPYFFQHLAEANIHEVHLDDNILGEVGGVLFANLIKSNNSLRKISLKNTMLNSNSLVCISRAIELEIAKGILKLEEIFLENNKFDDNSIETLMKTCELYYKKYEKVSNSSNPDVHQKFPRVTFSNNECISQASKENIRKSKFESLIIV